MHIHACLLMYFVKVYYFVCSYTNTIERHHPWWFLRIFNRKSNWGTGKVVSRNVDLESRYIDFGIYRFDKEDQTKDKLTTGNDCKKNNLKEIRHEFNQ